MLELHILPATVADMLYLPWKNDKPVSNAEAWSQALQRVTDNMADKKIYVTGGIGAIRKCDKFGIDYFLLSQGTDEGGCYVVTCAAIAIMMLAE